MHLISKSKDVVVESTNIIAKKSLTTFNINAFTPVLKKTITIYLQETDDCSTTNEVKLSEPTKILISKTNILVSTAERENLEVYDFFFFSGTFYGIKKFFTGIWDLTYTIFSNWQLSFLHLLFVL